MDYVVLCLDSVRFDTFLGAQPKNMFKIGRLQEAWSQGMWTLPSIMGMFWNYPHMGLNKQSFIDKYHARSWLPSSFKKDKYTTVFLNGNVIPLAFDNSISQFNLFRDSFDVYQQTHEGQTIKRFNLANSILNKKKRDDVFMFILEMATHNPYYDGKKSHHLNPKTPALNMMGHMNSINYVDDNFPILTNGFTRETTLIITSDHGELYGPDAIDHTPVKPTRFDEHLYRVPYIEAVIP